MSSRGSNPASGVTGVKPHPGFLVRVTTRPRHLRHGNRACRDRLLVGRALAVANRPTPGDKSGTQGGSQVGGLFSGLFGNTTPIAAGRPVRAGAAAGITAAGEKRPNRAPGAPDGSVIVSLEAFEAKLDDLGLKIEGRLGKGSRAQVFDVVASTDAYGWKAGDSLAVKALIGQVPAAAIQEMTNEIELWTPLRDDGIVQLFYSSMSPVPMLVLEHCDGGTLFGAIRRGDTINVPLIGLDIARALAHTHAIGQTHRDIKSANVLLQTDPSSGILRAKLCDWGSAAPVARSLPARPRASPWPFGSQVSWTPVGTLLWMAPEMLEPHFVDTPPRPGATGATADVFSFGTVLWELLERKLPWAGTGPVARKEVVQVVVRDGTRLPISPWVSPQISALIRSCWEDDPRKRPTMRQVVSRLESIDKWDTDGRLWRAAAGLEPLPPVPPSPSPRLSVPRTSGGTGLYVAGPLGRIEPGRPGSRVAAVIATAEEEEVEGEDLTLSEVDEEMIDPEDELQDSGVLAGPEPTAAAGAAAAAAAGGAGAIGAGVDVKEGSPAAVAMAAAKRSAQAAAGAQMASDKTAAAAAVASSAVQPPPAAKPAAAKPAAPLAAAQVEEPAKVAEAAAVASAATATPTGNELGTIMTMALSAAARSAKAGASADLLLASLLPYAYQQEIGPKFKSELDALVAQMKVLETRLQQLQEERPRFDPFGFAVTEGKRQELESIINKVQTMRAEAAVKAWARVAALLAEASQGAAKEYSAARKLLETARRNKPRK